MHAIKVQNLSKHFQINSAQTKSLKNSLLNFFGGPKQKLTVLDDISFTVNKGEFIGIIGQNGCGKSTLLKIIAGIIQPDSGNIQINGKISPFLELGVGFQEELSAIDNIYLYGALLGMTKSQVDQKLADIIAFSELAQFINTPLKHFSSGMYVRLAFSVAIHAEFEILLLDEVLAVGDIGFQQKCFQKFEEIKEQGKTIVFVSHNLKSVTKYSNKVIWIENGKIKSIGNPKRIINKYLQENILTDVKKSITSKEIEIKSVKLIQNNNIVNSINSEDKITIVTTYNNKNDISKLNFGIGIYSENFYEYILGINTQMDKFEIPKNKKNVTLELEKLNLLPGEYFINVVVFGSNEQNFYDIKIKAIKFVIYGPSKYRGLLNIKHKWKN